MSERDDLLASVANTIKTYRTGELPEPNPEHVDRWLRQFSPEHQLPFIREFDHVMKATFLREEGVKGFLQSLAKNEKLAGADPKTFWANAHCLKIQQHGQSQKAMLKVMAECLQNEYGLKLSSCGVAGGDYIYLDDVLFSGNRVGNDLERWIMEDAPAHAKLHVIVVALHSSGSFLVQRRLNDVIAKSGKKIVFAFWRAFEVENRKTYKNSSEVLWPAAIPEVQVVMDYMALPAKFPFEPRQPRPVASPFSSEAGRHVLEQEFLIAGAKIRALSENPKVSMRPLGFSPFGIGFGSLIVTYRNCPNNCPLAMWWGDPKAVAGALHWYPLLERDGYSSARNVFDDLTDF